MIFGEIFKFIVVCSDKMLNMILCQVFLNEVMVFWFFYDDKFRNGVIDEGKLIISVFMYGWYKCK